MRASFLLLVSLVVIAACTKPNPNFCEDDSECPGQSCDLDRNTCVPSPPPDAAGPDAGLPDASPPAVTVTLTGTGAGTVTSNPAGIDCPSVCSASFPDDPVELTASADGEDVFVQWGGACSGFESCEVVGGQSVDVIGEFGVAGELRNTRQYSASAGVLATAAAYDVAGNLVVTGFFSGTINFGGEPLGSEALSRDAFAVKFAPDRSHVWSVRLGGPGDDVPTAMAVAGNGDVVVSVALNANIDMAFDPISSGSSLVVRLAAADGADEWRHTITSTGTAAARAVAADLVGNVVVGGDFRGTIDFGADSEVNDDPSESDQFLVWYGPSGEYIRSFALGEAGSADGVLGLAMDDTSNTYVVGYFANAIAPDSGLDISIAKYTAAGFRTWSHNIGGADRDLARRVATDRDGNVYVTGTFSDVVDLGNGARTAAGQQDVFVSSYDSGGTVRWVTTFGSNEASGPFEFPDDVAGLSAGPRGTVALTGRVVEDVDFGAGLVAVTGAVSMFVVELGSTLGEHRRSRVFSASGADELVEGDAVAHNPVGLVTYSATLSGSVDFGAGIVSSVGEMFLVEFGP